MSEQNLADWIIMPFWQETIICLRLGDPNLAKMQHFGSTDNVNIIVEFDNAGDQKTQGFHILKGA